RLGARNSNALRFETSLPARGAPLRNASHRKGPPGLWMNIELALPEIQSRRKVRSRNGSYEKAANSIDFCCFPLDESLLARCMQALNSSGRGRDSFSTGEVYPRNLALSRKKIPTPSA